MAGGMLPGEHAGGRSGILTPSGLLSCPPFTTGGSIGGKKVEGAWKLQVWKYIITPPLIKIPE
jgi:hypothetical protein